MSFTEWTMYTTYHFRLIYGDSKATFRVFIFVTVYVPSLSYEF